MQINQIISMGGYGIYVWPAYCITLGVLGLNLLTTFFEKRRVKNFVKNYYE